MQLVKCSPVGCCVLTINGPSILAASEAKDGESNDLMLGRWFYRSNAWVDVSEDTLDCSLNLILYTQT